MALQRLQQYFLCGTPSKSLPQVGQRLRTFGTFSPANLLGDIDRQGLYWSLMKVQAKDSQQLRKVKKGEPHETHYKPDNPDPK